MVIWGSHNSTGGVIYERIQVAAAVALGLITGALAAAPASAWNRGNVQVLTVLPDNQADPPI